MRETTLKQVYREKRTTDSAAKYAERKRIEPTVRKAESTDSAESTEEHEVKETNN